MSCIRANIYSPFFLVQTLSMRIFPENMSSSALISTVDMKTEFAFKKEILACNGLFPLRRHKIWFGSNSWGEYFLRKKCELMSVLAVLELHLAQSI